MDLSRVSSKGQVTIPVEIREKLDLKEGDKVLFAEKDGNIVLLNASLVALKEIQKNMIEESEKQDLDQEDMNEYVKGIRGEIWKENYENND